MKKFLSVLAIICLVLVSGCTKVEEGNYKAGTYYGTVVDSYGVVNNTATAVVYVNDKGMIESVFLDTTYEHEGTITTKKTLGNDYGMKGVSASMGNIEGGAEWFEQVNALEEKIVSEQGLDFLEWSNEEKTKTDSVAGVTIQINALVEAANKAIEQAK